MTQDDDDDDGQHMGKMEKRKWPKRCRQHLLGLCMFFSFFFFVLPTFFLQVQILLWRTLTTTTTSHNNNNVSKKAQEMSTTSLGPRYVFFRLFFALLAFFLQISHKDSDERHLHSPQQQWRVDHNYDGSNHHQCEWRREKRPKRWWQRLLGWGMFFLFFFFCSTNIF